MLKIRWLSLLFIATAVLTGCATPPIQREISTAAGDPTSSATEEGTGRVVIINELPDIYKKKARNPALPAAESARDIAILAGVGQVNITIDGKGFAQLPIGKFVQVILPYGQHKLTLTHRDLIDMKSTHLLVIDKPVQRVIIYPTVGTHYFEMTDASVPLKGYEEIK